MTKRVLAILAMMIGGCGDNVPGATCGAGTTEVDGECVSTTTCGTGTVDDGSGNCVPDGTVVCTDGTVFDTTTGTCIPSDDVCGDGTVLVDGVCQDPSVVTPDATEVTEPNDDVAGGAGEITVPGIGQPGFVINGCITPRDNNTTEDIDVWFLQVNAPTALEIAADGVGGLAAGFYVLNVDGNEALDAYIRFGINTLHDSAKRQLYLPAAGIYALVMSDQRSLFGLGPAGNDNTCYYTTITQIALPAPVALTQPVQQSTNNGNLQVFRYTSNADGTVFRAEMTDESDLMDPGWVALKSSTFHGLATDQDGFSAGRARFVGGVNNTQTVDIVVDMEFNSAIAPQVYEIESYTIGASALPVAGTTVTVTKQNGVNPVDPIVDGSTALLRNANYYYFDVASDTDVVHFDLTATGPALWFIARADLVDNNFGVIDAMVVQNDTTTVGFVDEFVRFLRPGRYYLGLFHIQGQANQTYSLTSTLTGQNAPAVTIGTPINDAPISEVTGSAWREFAPSNANLWVEMTGGGANLGGDLEVLYYPASFEGWLSSDNNSTGDIGTDPNFDQLFAAAGTGLPQERILLNYPLKPFLVRFRSETAPAASQTFDYSITNLAVTDMGATSESVPAMLANVNIAANTTTRFIVRSTGRVNISVMSATIDAAVSWVFYDGTRVVTVDAAGAAGTETLPDIPAFLGYVAFEVENQSATAGMVNISTTTFEPAQFVEICPAAGGNGTLVLNGDDTLSATRTLPVTFSLYGTAVTQYKVSTNGWLTFNTLLTSSSPVPPAAIPSVGSPNGVIAGYWDDLQAQVCVRNDATRTIIEWSGFSWNTDETVQAQVSIYGTDNRIEWVYGPNHTADGTFAVGGVESLTGLTGFELFNDSPTVYAGFGDAIELP